MEKRITINEYRRRVYNMALSEGFALLYAKVLGEKVINETEGAKLIKFADHAKEVFAETMNLSESTMEQSVRRIDESGSTFARTLSYLAEAIANDRKDAAKEDEDLIKEVPDTLTEYEQEVVEKVFEERLSEDNLEEVRTAITNAIVDERNKSEEVKLAIELDKEKSEDGTLSEATVRMTKKLPTSLLEAIYKFNMHQAYQRAGEAGNVNEAIEKNKEAIVEGSHNIYAIYETMSKFGFKQYSPKEMEKLIFEYHTASK